jgi:inorganic pyrophosphatase
MIDGTQADDKIIAVLESDLAYGRIEEIRDVPQD